MILRISFQPDLLKKVSAIWSLPSDIKIVSSGKVNAKVQILYIKKRSPDEFIIGVQIFYSEILDTVHPLI